MIYIRNINHLSKILQMQVVVCHFVGFCFCLFFFCLCGLKFLYNESIELSFMISAYGIML